MGNCLKNNINPQYNLLMIGTYNSGQTKILYNLKKILNNRKNNFNIYSENIKTLPTIGYNYESIKYKNKKFNIWDVGFNNNSNLYKHFYKFMDGIIFVIDSTFDSNYIIEKLKEIINDIKIENYPKIKDKKIPILIWANKQDLPNSIDIF